MSTTAQTTTSTDGDRREAAVRRALRRDGHALGKSRVRSPNLDNQSGFMIVATATNLILAGEKFDLTLVDVERWVAEA